MQGHGSSDVDMPIEGYAPSLAAQAAAVFLIREGGSMDKLKLVKLLYLAERESVRTRMRPMFFDENFSLPNGPAGTNALSGIDRLVHADVWAKYLVVDGNRVSVADGLVEEDFGDVSFSDVDIIDGLSERFRSFSAYDIRDWTHDDVNVPEYEGRETGRKKIRDEDLARALGLPDPEGYADHVAELRSVSDGARA